MSYLDLALKTEIRPKTETTDAATQTLRAALTRLECGETPAVRIRINDREQVLILRDGEIPESITVDCPAFTLAELKKLIGSSEAAIKNIYLLKQADPGLKVVT